MDWASRIRDIRFTPVKLGEAYDLDQVDYLLDLLQVAAEQGDPLAPILEGVEVNQVRLREGYAIDEVDAFFAEVRATDFPPAEVIVPESSVPEAPTAPLVTAEPAEEEPARMPTPVPQPAPAPARHAISHKRGFFARFFGRD